MRIFDFEMKHVEDAKLIAIANYNEEREYVPILPSIDILPDLDHFGSNGLGVVAFDKGRMDGFLCCYKPWENAFNSKAQGTFSPIHAHGSLKENRSIIYKRMYQVAAEKWVKHNIAYHAIALYAHDIESINAMFTYGFGLRCVDAIRPMEVLQLQSRVIVFIASKIVYIRRTSPYGLDNVKIDTILIFEKLLLGNIKYSK